MVKRFIIGKPARSYEWAIIKRFTIGKRARSHESAIVKRFTIADPALALRRSHRAEGRGLEHMRPRL
jgi:hypothetical protein